MKVPYYKSQCTSMSVCPSVCRSVYMLFVFHFMLYFYAGYCLRCVVYVFVFLCFCVFFFVLFSLFYALTMGHAAWNKRIVIVIVIVNESVFIQRTFAEAANAPSADGVKRKQFQSFHNNVSIARCHVTDRWKSFPCGRTTDWETTMPIVRPNASYQKK